jgi:two-component system phosphate regulon response regulator OmpR
MLDDEDGIRHLFERACLKRGHSFTGAATLQEALTALAGQQFDVLLIDMQLVGMNGTQALQKIREEKINTPAIVLTGAVRPEYREALKHLGVIKTVEKSFDNLPLLKYIEELISGS